MHFFRAILFVFVLLKVCYSQQCRYVTVPICDNQEQSAIADGIRFKGEKGDRGNSGKSGPSGAAGAKGDSGQKGEKGSTANVDKMQRDFENRTDVIQSSLNQLLLPPNCASSSFVGYQMLRSGDWSFCDGGWIVFQKRYDGSVNFQQNWNEYKNGFGNFSTEFWLGLEKLHQGTFMRGCRLRVDLWSFDDDHAFAEYSDFSISNEQDMYRLHIAGYNGTAGDCFTNDNYHDQMPFTTPDRDNDNHSGHCSVNVLGIGGGWWFNNCQACKLNAAWGRSTAHKYNNVWYQWKGRDEAIKASIMKYRCD